MTWVLKRNCSASPMQLAIVFGSLVGVSFVFGAAFAALGFWMILPFAGLELAAIAAAFVWIGRHATDVERIELSDDRLVVESVEGARRSRWEFDAARVRVRLEQRGRGDQADVRVQLTGPGQLVEIGRHLINTRRLRLASELQGALANVQR
jgi:uncharacterized membrane protein